MLASPDGATCDAMLERPLQMLVVGDHACAEFRDVVPALRSAGNIDLRRTLTSLAAAPDLCVLLQSHPGEFAASELEAQLQRWPLARFISIAGSLCEGEPRTGRPWPGQCRVYWHAFPGWWALQSARMRQGDVPEWALPRTSREDDSLRLGTPVRWPSLNGVIGVAASHGDRAGGTLLAMLRQVGLNACSLERQTPRGIAGLQAILWDDDPAGGWRERALELQDRWPAVPLVALRNFPRVDDRDWLETHWHARCAVAAKPFDFDVLLASLAHVADRSGTAAIA